MTRTDSGTGDAVVDDGPLLSVDGLRTVFKMHAGNLVAVDGVSFEVGRGEVFSIVGESGSGKSVTAMSIMGLIAHPGEVVDGSIRFAGRELRGLPDKQMRAIRGAEISMIFQDPMTALNPVFEIGYQVGEPLRIHRGYSKKDALDAAVEALRRVGISDAEKRINDRPHEFSGGMRQRAMIAMAMITEPKLLIADEPTTALDVTIQAQILDLLLEICDERGTSVMLISHDLGVVASISDRMVVMYGGQVHEYGPALQVFEDPHGPYTWGLLAAVPRLDTDLGDSLRHIPGQPPSLIDPPTGCRFHPRCVHARDECATEAPDLVKRNGTHATRCHFSDEPGWTEQRFLEVAGDGGAS
jgi:oligopeptide/dipeptide ABC transporter ATP-binding protein